MTDFDKIISFDSLYKAHRRARLGKRWKKEVIEFEMHLSENLWALHYDLLYEKYQVGRYHTFMIYDPKEREIQAIPYRDRIVQHTFCDNFLTPLLDRHLIYDNAACRKNKGSHFAIKRLRHFMTEHYKKYGSSGYFIQIDVRKYFASIDHTVLKEKLERIVKTDDVLGLLYNIIDSYNKEEDKGLPMGNQTSQCFALLYLNDVDRFIKEILRVKHYLRYMDDMILLCGEKKEKCAKYLDKIKDMIVRDKVYPNKKTQICAVKNGINFLGWHFFYGENGKIVQKPLKQTKKRILQKVKYKRYLYDIGEVTREEMSAVSVSYRGHLQHGDAYGFLRKLNGVLLGRNKK